MKFRSGSCVDEIDEHMDGSNAPILYLHDVRAGHDRLSAGEMTSPEELAHAAKHRGLVFSVGSSPRAWRLTRANETREVALTAALAVNDLDILHDAVVGGAGIAILPAYRCVDDLRARRLERVLPDWEAPAEPIHALYPSGRHLSSKVKAMLDHLQQMKDPPWTVTFATSRSTAGRRKKSS